MSTFLVDTHAFLWFLFDDPRLSPKAAEAIAGSRSQTLVSIASLWEIVIKIGLDKLRLGMSVDEFFERAIVRRGVEVLDIELTHLTAYAGLPFHHRDPFDRLLIAQAIAGNLPVVTSDERFGAYAIEIVW